MKPTAIQQLPNRSVTILLPTPQFSSSGYIFFWISLVWQLRKSPRNKLTLSISSTVLSPDMMGARVGLAFLCMLCASWVCEPRQLISESSVIQIDEGNGNILPLEEVSRNENICTYCEEFASRALDYVSENKTQTEIIAILHITCSQVPTFKKECITLVDYYAPLFFLEVSSVGPEDFCRKVNLCKRTAISSLQPRQDSCGTCHYAVSEILIKLKDPDTQLEMIELLLKACNAAQKKKYVKKCKKMVFEYGPVIFVDAEEFLETTDICTIIHACKADGSEQASYSHTVDQTAHSDS